jgi:S-DNA-T family DNA segregation ATPase FtsK/SpoIIIE
MEIFTRVFTPSKNRRLNELVGFLLFAAAVLLSLALVSYSPLDNSWNTAATTPVASPARNWIGVVGAMTSDLLLQGAGVTIFLLPIMIGMLGSRWYKSRAVDSPIAKCIGGFGLMLFIPALLALLPWHLRFRHAAAVEGLVGRVFGDILIHYFNLVGAYIVCAGVITAALYLSTAFSLGAARLWMETRFAFAFAARDRFVDWKNAHTAERARRAEQKAKANAVKPVLTTQLIQKKVVAPPVVPVKTGIDRMMEEDESHAPAEAGAKTTGPEVGSRADIERKGKTIMPKVAGGYKLPSTALLHRPDAQHAVDEDELKELAQVLVSKCAEFDVHGKITQINPGPVVTTYEMKPEAGIKYSRITGLQEDLCLALRAESVLIERMAGKATVGIQVPNRDRETIWLREVIEAEEFRVNKSRLTLAMGKDINGRIITADLAAMPHLLIAGSTGAGKSVAINAMIMSILYKATPDQCRLILVDPKRLELGNYEGVPHLYTPIITEPKLAANALRNAVREMERRLKVLAERGVRNIEQYNKSFDEDKTPSLFEEATENEHKPLPYIVIIIDELADLMMLDQSNVEESITRLAQMARAVGIHLILATQRPSVDVITGLIKANFPARISFRVATKIDSRTILDANGAESLLGRGDMLYLPSGSARVVRVHAPLVTEKEIAAAVEFWRAQGLAQYEEKFLQAPKDESGRAEGGAAGDGDEEHDEMFEDAVRLVLEFGKASTSLIQRRLRVGYGRAAHLIDLMERDGIVGPADGPKPREILKRPDWLSEVEEALH